MTRASSVSLLVLVATGCASPAVHYHTLLAPAVTTAAAQPAPFLIDVLPVGIPAQIDHQKLVLRNGESGVVVIDGERWSGALGDELRSALSAELAQQLSTQDVAGLGRPAARPVLRIQLQIRRFDAWLDQKGQIDADWGLSFAGDPANARMVCSGRLSEPAAGGYPQLVQAMQRAIARLAEAISRDARAWSAARGADCIAAR